MVYQVFVSCSIWPQDISVIEPFRELVHLTGRIPWTVGIDEQVEDNKALPVIVRRIKESAALIVIHTYRYSVNGYLSSLWLQREPVIAAMSAKPVLEFYENGIREESLLRDISINQISFDKSELTCDSGKNKIKRWLQHFWWHVDLYRHTLVPLTTISGVAIGGLATRKLVGAIGGGLAGLFVGLLLDSLKPTCRICPRTYPPRLD